MIDILEVCNRCMYFLLEFSLHLVISCLNDMPRLNRSFVLFIYYILMWNTNQTLSKFDLFFPKFVYLNDLNNIFAMIKPKESMYAEDDLGSEEVTIQAIRTWNDITGKSLNIWISKYVPLYKGRQCIAGEWKLVKVLSSIAGKPI